jgi:DNA repair exonuclease SbcCD ATPase subunit
MANWKKYSNEGESTSNPNASSAQPFKAATVVMAVLFVLASGAAIYFYNQSTDEQSQKLSLKSELDETRTSLEGELSNLETDYNVQVTENDSLSVAIEERVKEVNELQTKIKSMRGQLASSKSNAKEIKAKLAKLEELKTELEGEIDGLKEQNVQLAEANSALNSDLEMSRQEATQLNAQVASLTQRNEALHNRLTVLAPAGYRADNFSVSIEKRNNKLTSKAKRADEIRIAFDLDNVPQENQGDSEIYVAVMTLQGQPVTAFATSMVSVPSIEQQLKVEVADVQQIQLKNNQRMKVSLKPNNDLEAGDYNLMVYSDTGYLGSTGFSLR